MSVYKRGNTWWYEFTHAGRRIIESAKTKSKTIAKEAEKARVREMENGFNGLSARKDRVRALSAIATDYLAEYKLLHPASYTFAQYAVDHVVARLGDKMVIEIDELAVKGYRLARLGQKAAPKSINEEIGFLLRMMGKHGDLLRVELRRGKELKLAVSAQPGKAFSVEQKDAMMVAAAKSRSPLILPALTLALNAGMRDAEIKRTRWSQIDFAKGILTVGNAKSAAGEGRTIPLNTEVLDALLAHAKWYVKKFGETRKDWFLFPFGRRGGMDPSRSITTLKTAWTNVRTNAKVTGRWHDARHTLITELAESGAGDQTIMDIAGHVSRQMLARYSHIRTEAKRDALQEVLARRDKTRTATAELAKKKEQESAENGLIQ
jgi:integrase